MLYHVRWLLGLVGLMLVGAMLPPHTSARAASALVSATPSTLALTLPLGSVTTQAITITNPGATPITPTITEAWPAYPAAQPIPQVGSQRVSLPPQAARIDPQLAQELAEPTAQADFVVFLRSQADLSTAYQIRDWSARGEYVYRTLQAHAARTQAGMLAALAARGLRVRPLWIVNAVVVHGTLADAQVAAARDEVALVRANHLSVLPVEQSGEAASSAQCSPDAPANPVCWNIRQIGADRVWREFGVTGRGIVVASIDTGANFAHPALLPQYRGYRGSGAADHNYNWFDPKLLMRAPNDLSGHGTHTMGIMVGAGAGTTQQPAIGVAPEARWIIAQGCAWLACSDVDLIESAQWMLAPTALDGTNPRPDMRPMIINNSWATGGGDRWYAGYVAAWRAAGIFPIFAVGNAGSACSSVGSPSDYADVLGVGATDQHDIAALFSARGPTIDGRTKPDVMAPGGSPGILSTGLGTDYRTLQGTSMASPHVAGLVALLWSANPDLIGDYDRTVAAIEGSAHAFRDNSCGSSPNGANNVYGYGRIDAYAAVQRARVDVPWLDIVAAPSQIAAGAAARLQLRFDAARVPAPGSYHARVQIFVTATAAPLTIDIQLDVLPTTTQAIVRGRVRSADTHVPLAATVQVAGGQSASTGVAGDFTLVLAPGVYQLEVAAPSFLGYTQTITVSGDRTLPDIQLQPAYPRMDVTLGSLPPELAFGQVYTTYMTLANTGVAPLQYTARVLPDWFTPLRSDEAGGPTYAWVNLPASARQLVLNGKPYSDTVPIGFSFPFYSYTFTETAVAADGFLAFSRPPVPYNVPVSGCFPDIGFDFYEIAPFRTDIDLARGGMIRYATINNGQTFVVSYEDVRLAGNTSGSYSFQVLLQNDGRIVYQYRDLPAVPEAVAVGVQRTTLDYQVLGCSTRAPAAPGLAIELRPQPLPSQWLELLPSSGTVPPHARRALTVALRWVLPRWMLQRAQIELISNDPLHRRVILPVALELKPAPFSRWMPMMWRNS